VVINKSFIVFVLEIPDLGAPLGGAAEEPEMRRFGRAALRLRTRDHAIEGFVHSGPGSSSLARLNQAYERKFGFRFVVFVNRRPKSAIVPILRDRIERTREEELGTALEELVSIAEDRWRRR